MVFGIGTLVSDMFIEGGKSPVFGSPKDDFNLEYQDVEFARKDDGKILRGWWIPSPSNKNGKVIVQSHFGVMSSRSGYTPEGKGLFPISRERIEYLRAIPEYLEEGYSVLMYDMTNHGESDVGTCPYVSWGPNEAYDVLAAVEYCVNSKNMKQVYLLSICMGSVASTRAFAMENGLSDVSEIKAMVAIQPASYSEIVKNMGIPAFVSDQSTPVTTKRLGFDLNTKSCMDDADKISVPTLVIQNNNDPWHRHEWIQSFYDKIPRDEKEMMWLDLETHRFASYKWITEHPEKIVEWFNKH